MMYSFSSSSLGTSYYVLNITAVRISTEAEYMIGSNQSQVAE